MSDEPLLVCLAFLRLHSSKAVMVWAPAWISMVR